MITILQTIASIILIFTIVIGTRTENLPKLLSLAEETISNIINLPQKNVKPTVNLKLTANVFPPGENISLYYSGESQSFSELSIEFLDGKNNPVQIQSVLHENKIEKILEIEIPKKLKSGKYHLKIKQAENELINEDIYLGSVVANRQKTLYQTGEDVILDVAFFSNNGELSCPSDLLVEVTNTNTNINDNMTVNSGRCLKENFTPYRLTYKPKNTGTYVLKIPLKETGNNNMFVSTFNSYENKPAIELIREAPTFINNQKNFDVKMTVSSAEDFQGTLVDFVPVDLLIKNSDNSSFQAPTVLFDKSTIKLRSPFNDSFPVTLGFGEVPSDQSIENNYKNFEVKAHDGIDYALPEGTPVLAVDDGKVIDFPVKLSSYGNTVVLEHLWGGRTFYGHLSQVKVQTGQKVSKGDVIGLSGQTGLSFGQHLHFGMDFKNGDVNNGFLGKIDPSPYISAGNKLNISMQKLVWNIFIKKGEKRELGYSFKVADDGQEYFYYRLGPAGFFDKNENPVFMENSNWIFIKE